MALWRLGALGALFAVGSCINGDDDDPMWGCGLLGHIPGIEKGGVVTSSSTQEFIDALRNTSSFGKVNYWNWNLAPETTNVGPQYLTKDFIFMPEQWGVTAVNETYVRKAGQANFVDGNGEVCPATMSNIFLGSNEPDITGSCLGNMMGKCRAPCLPGEQPCPTANQNTTSGEPNAKGHCDCYSHSAATGAGFWPVEGCSGQQPLPTMFEDHVCAANVMANWKKTAQTAVSRGYKYLSTPLVAVDIEYARKFLEQACGCTAPGHCKCTSAECGCPVYVGFHFYGQDCQPSKGGYADFKAKLTNVSRIMDDYPFVKGAIINEVGMLNCQMQDQTAGCVPNSGKYPASSVPDHSCPVTPDLPDGLATFIEKLFDMVIAAKTKNGRSVVKSFAWFNENMDGGTYNLRLFDDKGALNDIGKAYIRECSKWAKHNGLHRAPTQNISGLVV